MNEAQIKLIRDYVKSLEIEIEDKEKQNDHYLERIRRINQEIKTLDEEVDELMDKIQVLNDGLPKK